VIENQLVTLILIISLQIWT